jgi:hypothetical protein
MSFGNQPRVYCIEYSVDPFLRGVGWERSQRSKRLIVFHQKKTHRSERYSKISLEFTKIVVFPSRLFHWPVVSHYYLPVMTHKLHCPAVSRCSPAPLCPTAPIPRCVPLPRCVPSLHCFPLLHYQTVSHCFIAFPVSHCSAVSNYAIAPTCLTASLLLLCPQLHCSAGSHYSAVSHYSTAQPCPIASPAPPVFHCSVMAHCSAAWPCPTASLVPLCPTVYMWNGVCMSLEKRLQN